MTKHAVVIGINDYQDEKKIRSLKGAENDANEVCTNLSQYGGFDIVACLTGHNASFSNIRQAMSDLFLKTDESELALFYFSGHGFKDGFGQGYIAPYDFKYADPFVRGIRIRELRELFLISTKPRALLLLDSCHSGVATENGKGEADTNGSFYGDLELEEPDEESQGTGRFILASSRADQESREQLCKHQIQAENAADHYHGIFSFHLLEALNGQAADGDLVTLNSLYTYLSEQMKSVRDQERTFWGFGAGAFDDTVLVKASQLRALENLFDQTDQHLSLSDEISLFEAIRSLADAVRGYPGSKRIEPLEAKINQRLLECGAAINRWRGENLELRVRLARFKEFRTLEALAQELSFERLTKESLLRKNLLLELIQVSQGTLDFNVLLGDLSRSVVAAPPVSGPGGRS